MKFSANILFLLFYVISFSQNVITHRKTVKTIKNSSKDLCVNLIIPDKEFSIGIYTEIWEVEDLSQEQCGDIKTDEAKNSEIIKLLNKRRLLDKLYLEMENNQYEMIGSNEKFKWNETQLIIELNFNHYSELINQVYIPINNRKQAKDIIRLFKKIFDSDYCFKKLKRTL